MLALFRQPALIGKVQDPGLAGRTEGHRQDANVSGHAALELQVEVAVAD